MKAERAEGEGAVSRTEIEESEEETREADVKKVLSQISRRGGSSLQRFVKSQSAKAEGVAVGSVSV